MSFTDKGVIIAVIPVFITALATIADNSIKWRAEMEQKRYDRQTRLIDRIMEIEKAEDRLSVANFYLSIGVFDGDYKKELNFAIDDAIAQINKKNAEELAKKKAAIAERELVAKREPTSVIQPLMPVPDSPVAVASPPPPKEPAKPLTKKILDRANLPNIFSFDR